MKLNQKIFLLALLTITKNVMADDSIFENNIDIATKKNELNLTNQDHNLNKSTFYPEINIITGIGSEYTTDKTETEKGGMLYLDSKINLFNGYRDFNNNKILESRSNKISLEKELEVKKVKNSIVKLLAENQILANDMQLLYAEININQGQEIMAKKKIDAGLNTNAELLDFQLKETNLNNELSIIEIKIKDNENEVLNLIGHSQSLESIKKEFNLETETNLRATQVQESLENKVLLEDLKISDLEINRSKGSYSPRLDLEAKAGKITPTTKLFQDKTEHQVALNLTIPLFSGFSSSAEIEKSNSDRVLKERSLRNFQANFEGQANLEKRKIELNKKLLSSNELMLSKASKFYEQSLVEYKRGIKNSSDIISASDRVLEIKRKINELKSQIKVDSYCWNNKY